MAGLLLSNRERTCYGLSASHVQHDTPLRTLRFHMQAVSALPVRPSLAKAFRLIAHNFMHQFPGPILVTIDRHNLPGVIGRLTLIRLAKQCFGDRFDPRREVCFSHHQTRIGECSEHISCLRSRIGARKILSELLKRLAHPTGFEWPLAPLHDQAAWCMDTGDSTAGSAHSARPDRKG